MVELDVTSSSLLLGEAKSDKDFLNLGVLERRGGTKELRELLFCFCHMATSYHNVATLSSLYLRLNKALERPISRPKSPLIGC